MTRSLTRSFRFSSCALLSAGVAIHAAAAQNTPPVLIARAVRAMAGERSLDSIHNKVVEFNTTAFALGQEETDLSPARATLSFGRTVNDYRGMRQLTTQESRAVSGAVTRLRRVTRQDVSMAETNGVLSRDAASMSAGLARGMSLQIDQVLRAASHHPSVATPLRPRALGGEMADGVRLALGPDTLRVWFDRATGLPRATETIRDDDVLGDRRTLTWYTRWQDAGGVKLPRQVDVEVNGRLLNHTVFTNATINQPLDDTQFAIPDSIVSRAAPAAAAPPTFVQLVQLAPGVWRAEGSSHHSMVIDQGPGLVVVEAPLSTARANALLDTLRARFPTKPVRSVVMTHHHHDHSAGIRAFMSRGVRVVAHNRNLDFVRGVGAATKTVAPDAISRGAKAPAPVGVGDSLVVGGGPSRVVAYPLPTTHAEGMLAVWVPAAGVVFTSDVLSPAANQPLARVGSLELVEFARRRGLRPTRFVGGHGAVVEWTAIEGAGRAEF